LSAALAPVFLIGGWTVAAGRQPTGYSPARETTSALAGLGATDRWVMTIGLAALGICHLVTALGLRPAAGTGRLLLATGGVATVLVAVFPVPRAPRANAYAERWVRTVRSECLDWTLVWNERQLCLVLTEYLRHYNTVRPHRSVELQPPRPVSRLRLVEPGVVESSVQRVDVLGGLIHEYRRAA
jgi:hypothetical protein